MNKKTNNVYVVAKNTGSNCPYIQNNLDKKFSFECHDNCNAIPKPEIDRPLLHPVQLILFFTDGWEKEEIAKDIENYILPLNSETKLFTFLFITSEDCLPTICEFIQEDDDFVLETSSPFIISKKINQLIKRGNLYKKLTRDLNEASEIALLSMSNSSELGEISRFILTSYGCKTYEELMDALFYSVVMFNIKCSALIVVDDCVVVRLCNEASQDSRKTLLHHHNRGRIHHLGKDIIITFSHTSILIHEMPTHNETLYGRLIDNLTILANCFEARVKGIHSEQEADAASKAKTMFLATMSHELRTPMNSVIGFTERLMEKLNGRLNEKEEKHLHAIKRNGDHLLKVINDILDMSKIEVGKMEIHPEHVDAVAEINNIFIQLQPIAQNNNLEFNLEIQDTDIAINADSTRFTQMVMNLVSNAIKYTPKGFVTITIYKVNDSLLDECTCISVTDSGIGISEEDQKRLFGNFVQIDSELCRKVQGTGLGLAISMIFANMHGGRIDVKSEKDIGSCFSLYLPLSSNPKAPQVVADSPHKITEAAPQSMIIDRREDQSSNIQLF